MLTLTEEQRKQLLQYLGRRPYIETAMLIQMLASLTPPKKKEENKANNTDKSRN
jgi:hypothetical protein